MSIYTCKGFETNRLIKVESETDDFTTIVNSKVITFDDVSSIDSIKRHESYYFIAGELSEPTRNNDNVLNKTLVTLDYDDLDMTEEEFKAHLMSKISVLKFLSYPSISNGLKGTRYRVIIPTDRPYTKEESSTVIQFITEIIGLPYDAASETWAQLMSLKCTFESEESFEDKSLLNEGRGLLKIENALKQMAERKPKKQKKEVYFKTDFGKKKKFTASFMEELMEGVDEGGRDNWLTKQYGRMLSLGFDYVSSYEWLELINREFVRPPLNDSDLNRIVMSIAKKEKRKYSNAREG